MRFLLLGVAITLLVGCGQKGPLYLRDNPPPGVKPRNWASDFLMKSVVGRFKLGAPALSRKAGVCPVKSPV